MRALIVSDIHANPWALRAVMEDAGPVDHVLCAGDTVNYGPDPAGAVTLLRQCRATTVQGNHDYAVAFVADPKAAPAKQPLACAMCDWTREQLAPEDLDWLAALPLRATCEIRGARFLIIHATPADPLYDYRLTPAISDDLLDKLLATVDADVLVVGHTHLPLLRCRRKLQIVNPGSVGQPLDGDPRAAYALWEDGSTKLCRIAYDLRPALDALAKLPIPRPFRESLQEVLRQGRMN
jgi:putative phosphoesterase